ncbi:MAG TPA: hypothetical protein EYG11_10530 [Candidatus Latescibacteria bacterium]|nr:hypothetical protein [Candidatus Handelsmanbacteria bacterium]HIL09127.1 hypothetical protein [Candidatus Latescibacterota bacterium]
MIWKPSATAPGAASIRCALCGHRLRSLLPARPAPDAITGRRTEPIDHAHRSRRIIPDCAPGVW